MFHSHRTEIYSRITWKGNITTYKAAGKLVLNVIVRLTGGTGGKMYVFNLKARAYLLYIHIVVYVYLPSIRPPMHSTILYLTNGNMP